MMSGFFVFREPKKLQDWHDVTATSEDNGVELDVSRAGSQQCCSVINKRLIEKALLSPTNEMLHRAAHPISWLAPCRAKQ